MKERADLRAPEAPDEVRGFQLTEPGVPSCHIYMEAQVFTPDCQRFVLHRSCHPHGSDRKDPEHRYLLCDLEADGELIPLTDGKGATAPAISPDGRFFYYFVDRTDPRGGSLSLMRLDLQDMNRRTVAVIDTPVAPIGAFPSRPYPLATISSDGARLALSAFFGDGATVGAPWGLLVFDLSNGRHTLLISGPTWCNMHAQYSRSLDAAARRDILIQENHGNRCDASGAFLALTGGAGADIHCVRDDGTHLRDLPWGRDGDEFCQGHQCWRGRSRRVIAGTVLRSTGEARLVEGEPSAHTGHRGRLGRSAFRNDLSRSHPRPDFWHFATDLAGALLITDSGKHDEGGAVYLARLPPEDGEPAADWMRVARPGSSWTRDGHMHPFLSPDGRSGFFNSDESGVVQAYMVSGWK